MARAENADAVALAEGIFVLGRKVLLRECAEDEEAREERDRMGEAWADARRSVLAKSAENALVQTMA